MSDLTEFYLNSKRSTVKLECLELSHSSFSQTYYLVRNATHGVTVTHEDETSHAYTYVPMRVERSGSTDDLDHWARVVLGDLGEIVPAELDRVRANDAFEEEPTVIYRAFRHDVLTAPLIGPVRLQVRDFTMDRNGCSFEAAAPRLNLSRTGERYSIARFPMLSGLLK